MAITEEGRHRLYERLEQLLGTEEATTLMEHLPPVGWADVATRRDLDAHAVATRRDLDAHAVATKRDLESLKRDLESLKRDLDSFATAIRSEMAIGAAELRSDMAIGAAGLRTEMAEGLRRQTVQMTFAMLAANATLAGLAFAAARLA